jgi:uncharacterized membrane protein YsdA (DUF1294 family)
MCYYVGFGTIGVVMAAILYPLIYNSTTWNPYAVWIVAWSITAFLMYGLDWLLAKMGNVRTPDLIFCTLAALGGFPGVWLGVFAFRGKFKFLENVRLFVILALSTIGHGLLTYHWFVRPLR